MEVAQDLQFEEKIYSRIETLFDELKRYVRFGGDDEAALRALHPVLARELADIADVFYRRILEHEGARVALVSGESQTGRLKLTLIGWLERLLRGPWDEEYFDLRCRIGRVHVRIELPQHYMLTAMVIVQKELGLRLDRAYAEQPEERQRARDAIEKILGIDLAIMLHAYREDMTAQRVRIERLSTFGQLVGSISHELRNPLAIIESSLFLLKNRVTGDEAALKHISRINEQLNISGSIVAALLDLVRDRPLLRERLQLHRLVQEVLATLLVPSGVKVHLEGLDGVPEFQGDGMQLRQALRNLIENALHATGSSGEVRLRAHDRHGTIEISVADSGPGVAPEIRPRLFEPLISNKPGGTGLGLPLAKRFIERHGGTILYAPGDAGARFIIKLPLVQGEPDCG